MIAAISRKKGTHTGFTNDNKTITKTITFGIKNGPCETLPFFPFSSPFPVLFPVSSFTLPFPSPFLFPVLFPFLFRFLFRSFSFRFPFLFLPLSFSSPFRVLSFPFLYYSFSFSLSSLMWILWSRCEASAWKNDKRKKKITSGKTIWKGSGFLQTLNIIYNMSYYIINISSLSYHLKISFSKGRRHCRLTGHIHCEAWPRTALVLRASLQWQ